MITCYCNAFGCNKSPKGSKLSVLEAQRHRAKDRELAENEALRASQTAIDAQEVDLAAAVAALTLSGATNTQSANSVSSSVTPSLDDVDTTMERTAQAAEFWDQLKESFISLQRSSALHDSRGDIPSARDSPFPLNDEVVHVRSLVATIRNTITHSPALKTRRQGLLEDVLDLEERLVAQRKHWYKDTASLPQVRVTPSTTDVYDTGMPLQRALTYELD